MKNQQNPTYRSWRSMRNRCLNPNSDSCEWYGGAGIEVDPSWNTFEQFLDDMGPRPEGTTLDRIDSAGDYGPSNCRWATPKEQRANQKARTVQKGKELPMGVHPTKSGKFMAIKRLDGSQVYLGSFDTPEEASAVYEAR